MDDRCSNAGENMVPSLHGTKGKTWSWMEKIAFIVRRRNCTRLAKCLPTLVVLTSCLLGKYAVMLSFVASTSFELAFAPCTSESLIIYNRIPKTGSTSFNKLLRDVMLKQGYHVGFDLGTFGKYSSIFLSEEEVHHLEDLLRTAHSSHSRMLVHGHFYFLPKLKNVTWINWVRDPWEHFLSRWRWRVYLLQKKFKSSFPDISFERCTHLQSPFPNGSYHGKEEMACRFLVDMTLCKKSLVEYFCGYAKVCARGSRKARLDEAKSNLNYYTFVGVLEYPQESLSRFGELFSVGASKYPRENVNKKVSKPNLSKSLMPTCMLDEYELYSLIVQRLLNSTSGQKLNINSRGSIKSSIM